MELRKMLKVLIRVPGSIKIKGTNLSKLIIDECQKQGILGSTIIQCIHGYGERDYKPHILRGIGDLPIIIEIIDDPMAIQKFIPKLKELVKSSGLITVEEVYAV